jgi:myo-inositol-1-phosphate synthase
MDTGAAPLSLDLRLEVQGSPNCAAVVTDLVRYAAVARDLEIGGVINHAYSYYTISPPQRMDDKQALEYLRDLIQPRPRVATCCDTLKP